MSVAKYDAYNLDVNESAFFKGQLEMIKAATYDTKYKPNKILTLLPISSEAGPAVAEITWRAFSRVGVAKMVSDYAQDFPRVDIYGVEYSVKPKGLGASYGYSVEEIRRAQMAGLPLETRRAEAARRAVEDKMASIALTGETGTNLKGFINYSGITSYTVASGGTGGSKKWADKTAAQILDDMHGIVHGVVNATNGIEQPDTMLMPLAQYNLISTKRLGDGSDETVMSYFLKTNRYITRIDWLTELKDAGGTGVDHMMVYVNDPMHLTLEIPLMFEQYEADKKAMAYEIPCYAKTAGVIIYYPASVAAGSGI
jgi:hypothetical protein